MERVTLGMDVGTSALKVSIYSIDQRAVIQNRNVKYEEAEVRPGVSRLCKYTDIIIRVINESCEVYDVKSIAFSTQMYSFAVEEEGEILIYQWNAPWQKDPEVEAILEKYIDISGCPTDTLFPAYKIISARRKGIDLNVMQYGLQEAIVNNLTGRLIGDYCNLSSTGFMNVKERKWNEGLLKEAGFDIDKMPERSVFNQPVGVITNTAVKGGENILVACGLGDGPSASYASKDVSNLAANIGTSMAVRGFMNNIDHVDFSSVWTFVVDPETWVCGGISSNGSSVLDHYRNMKLLQDWELNPAKANLDIYYFPWKNGERTPYWSSNMKETMVGADMNVCKNDYMCAIFRGIAYTIVNMYNKVNTLISEDDMMCMAGGGVNSEILMYYLAGTMPIRLAVLKDFDYLGAYGAAYAAAEAAGESPKRNQELVKIYIPTHRFEDNYKQWREYAENFRNLYENREG